MTTLRLLAASVRDWARARFTGTVQYKPPREDGR